MSKATKASDFEWVMVPREPTNAMCEAAWKYGVGDEAPDPNYAYRAMLAAAPKPERAEAVAQGGEDGSLVGVEGLAEMWKREAAELVRNARDARARGAATVDDFARADRLDAKADGLHEAAADLLALAQQRISRA